MIGWRVGWVAGPAATVEDVGWAHVYNTTTPSGIARRAATEVLRGDQGHVAAFRVCGPSSSAKEPQTSHCLRG
jgi:aspartate/methionine/tyrosine aminotransferase